MSVASSIRNFFDELFYSKLTETLQNDLLRLRQDFEERLLDKDRRITELIQEKALLQSKVTSYELTIMPMSSKAGADYIRQEKPTKPNFSGLDFSFPAPVSRWQTVVNEHEAQLAREEAEEKEKNNPKPAAQEAKA